MQTHIQIFDNTEDSKPNWSDLEPEATSFVEIETNGLICHAMVYRHFHANNFTVITIHHTKAWINRDIKTLPKLLKVYNHVAINCTGEVRKI